MEVIQLSKAHPATHCHLIDSKREIVVHELLAKVTRSHGRFSAKFALVEALSPVSNILPNATAAT